MTEVDHSRQVEAMAGYGISPEDIATVLGIDRRELELDYRRELDSAAIKANAKVAESLFRKATGEGREGVIAAIFWLKSRARWRETQAREVTGMDGGPVQIEEPSPRRLAMAVLALLRGADTDTVEAER